MIYVDDLLIASSDKSEIHKLKLILNEEFDMKDLGATRRILGIDIIRDRKAGTLKLSQARYLKKVIDLFGMKNCKPVTTPIPAHYKPSTVKGELPEEEEKFVQKVPYSNAVGSLMYSMIGTRPDIAYGVSLVSRFMSKPSKDHWKTVKSLLRYLKGTVEVGLVYESKGVEESCIQGYCDSDYTADLDKRRSLTGYIFTIGGNVVSWKSNLLATVALSTQRLNMWL